MAFELGLNFFNKPLKDLSYEEYIMLQIAYDSYKKRCKKGG